MRATISWWDLSMSEQTIDTLRDYLAKDGVGPWANINGLLLKFWISDRKTNRWGAVMLWHSTTDLTAPMPPNRAAELIGYPPTVRMSANIEAIIGSIDSGHFSDQDLFFEPLGIQL